MATARKQSTKKKGEIQAGDEEPQRGAATRPDEMPADVLEFITAIDDYKRLNRRPFPTWSEVLEVVKSLGYKRGA